MQVEFLDDTQVRLITRTSFTDERGAFTRIFCEETFQKHNLLTHYPHVNFSQNVEKFTLRGLHYQTYPHQEDKMITCVSGKIFNVAVDMQPNSPTYLKYVSQELSAENKKSLYIPKGYANGFMTLEENTSIVYFVTTPYNPDFEKGVHYADPAINIKWPHPAEVISQKDQNWDFIS